MQPPAPQPGDAQGVVVLVLFLVGLGVAYRRTALKLLVVILISLAVLSVILAVVGTLDALRYLHHIAG